MSSDYMMQQCKLRKHNNIQVSWIPSKYAIKGKFLRLKDDNGWEVVEVAKQKVPYSEQQERSRDYSNTRKASDI